MLKNYKSKLSGAIIGRFAGCALGCPVELMEIGELQNYANKIGQEFPPLYYFKEAPNPDGERYSIGKGRHFTSTDMKFLSTDDDIAYTLLTLLNLEKYGESITTDNIADSWIKYLPLECTFTAERTTLSNLLNGVSVEEAGKRNNDEDEYIGASIRIDGYGYVNPGNPLEASKLAYIDASLSHKDSGVYSAMYFAALIALAFESKDIDLSMYDALQYIPSNSVFHKELTWALSVKETVTDYQIANDLVKKRYPGMSWVHAINNACLTVWGIHLGRNNYTKGISETVAMAYDNDCTAATVGSVLGAYLGIEAIDAKWYTPWNNRILSYLKGITEFKLNEVIERFYKIAIEKGA